MQQSSATPKKKRDTGIGLQKIVALNSTLHIQCLQFWHSVFPTSYFIANDFYTCLLVHRQGSDDRIFPLQDHLSPPERRVWSALHELAGDHEP